MTATRRRRTLSVRGWFALAAVTTFGLIVIVVLTSVLLLGVGEYESQERVERAATVLRRGADRWHDPAWRAATAAELGADEVSFVLFEDGDEVFRSDAAVGRTNGERPAGALWDTEGDDTFVRLVRIDGSDPPREAQLASPLGGDDPRPEIARATVVLGGVAAAVALAFGRPFVRSLDAVRRAAHQVTGGDLGVDLPRSRITEVDELNTAFAAMTDELDRALEQQAALEHERRMFIAAIAHDLRTPLFSLRGYLDGLETGVADTPEQRNRYLAVASEKARTLDRLVSDLFDFTRLEYLDQPPDRHPLDLAALLHDLVDGLQPHAAATGRTLSFDAPDHPCPVEGDREELARAVTNLVDNALRYTPAGGRIDITCGTTAETAWFRVSDTGPGIAPDDLPHLFQPLYRGQNGGGVAGGTGLGLAIAHRILVAHHGSLEVGNAAAGGAVFTATIPVRTD